MQYMGDIGERVSWGIMFIIGVSLVTIGFQGALGKVLACIVCPSQVVING